MIRKSGLLFFQSILLGSFCSPSYTLEDTPLMRENNYTSISEILDTLTNLQTQQNISNSSIQGIDDGASNLTIAINNVKNSLGHDNSITSNNDIYGLITDSYNGATSGIMAKLDGTTSGTVLNKIESLENLIDGTSSMTGSSSDNLSYKINAVNNILGGSGTIQARSTTILNNILTNSHTNITGDITTLDNQTLTSPTGNLQTDLTTARGLLVSSLGSTLQTDINAINSSIGGSGTTASRLTTEVGKIENGATVLDTAIGDVQTKLGSSLNSSLTTNTDLYRILTDSNSGSRSGLLAKLTSSPSSSILSGIETIALGLDGSSAGSITGSPTNNLENKLLTQISNIEDGSTQLNTAINDVNSVLGGSGTTINRARSINSLLLTSPTDNLQTDLTTARTLLVDSPGSTLQTDINTINSSLGGSGTTTSRLTTQIGKVENGATVLDTAISDVQTKLGSSLNSSLTTNTDLYRMLTDLNSGSKSGLLSKLTVAQSSSLLSGIEIIAQRLDGSSVGSITGSSTSNLESKVLTQISNIENGSTQLSTAINDVNSVLGGSGTTINRARSINSLLDGVQNLSGLSSFTVSTAATNSGGIITIIGNDGNAGQSYSIDTSISGINIGDGTGGTAPIASGSTFTLTHSGSGNTITFVNNSGGSIISANALAIYLATAYPVNFIIKNTTNQKVTALGSLLGGSGYSAMNNAVALDLSLLSNPTGALSNDLLTLAGEIVTVPSGVIETDVQTLNSLLNGTASGSTTQARIGSPVINGAPSNLTALLGGTEDNIAGLLGDPGDSKTIIGNIGGSTTSVQDALNALSMTLVNNTSFSSSLSTNLTTQSTILDSGLSSLPNEGTFATIGTGATSDGAGGVNITISAGLGSGNGTYNLSAATITSGIGNGSPFTLTNGADNIVLLNRSGSTINTQAKAISYLASMYPVASRLATGISDKITYGINNLVGGTAQSVRARIAAVDATLLTTPTGVLTNDLGTINSLLNGTAAGSTTQERIGTPMVSGVLSNLSAVIGGSGSDLATRLGDPVIGADSSLSGFIKASSVNTPNPVYLPTALDNFKNATNLYDQLQYFLDLFSPDNFTTTTNTQITFTINGSITSLSDIINSATSTS